MKNFIIVFLIILCFCFAFNLHAQWPYAVPFLIIDLSPNLNGMAGAFTALPTNDVYGAYFNPAQIGLFSTENNFAVGLYPQKTDWGKGFTYNDLYFHANALTFGYQFKSSIPVNIGFSYIYNKFDLGENVWTDATGRELATFNSYEGCSAFSLGIGVDFYLKFSLGFTYKDIYSRLIPVKIQNEDGIAEASAIDYGLLISAPLADFIIPQNNKIELKYKPIFDLSIGYSSHNIGDKVIYDILEKADPLPRQARLGYGLSIGISKDYHDSNLKIIKFDFSTEARDILIIRTIDKTKYKNMFGDIDFFKNIITGKTNDNITLHRGWRIKLFDTFQYSSGRILGKEYINFEKSSGFSFSSKGVLIWLAENSNYSTLKYIAAHFSLEYAWSKYKTENDYLDNTKFNAVQLKIFGY